jgi:hypothetical protein
MFITLSILKLLTNREKQNNKSNEKKNCFLTNKLIYC